jgi:Kdo2-lipid IVA lauroyltransferase/acyltransferase
MPKSSQPKRAAPLWRRIKVAALVHAIVFIARILVWLTCRLSYERGMAFARWLTARFEPLTRAKRARNFARFYPATFPAEQRESLDAAHQRYLARMRLEVVRAFEQSRDEALSIVDFVGEEHLRAALALNRGVLLIGGHTGTWWSAPAALPQRGYACTAVFTTIAFPVISRQLLRIAEKFGVKIAFVGESAHAAVRNAVQQNEVVYLSYDVAVRLKHSVPVRFGEGTLMMDPGPAVLALRYKMPVVQVACTQVANRRLQVKFYPADDPTLIEGEEKPLQLCTRWLARLENELRENPEQWWAWGYVTLAEREGEAHRPARAADPITTPEVVIFAAPH